MSEIAHTSNALVAWKECLNQIKDHVPFLTYHTWFLPIKPILLEESVLKIKVPNRFFIEWIDSHYKPILQKTVKKVLGDSGRLDYQVDQEQENIFSLDEETILPKSAPVIVPKKEEPAERIPSSLNPRYTFDNFIQGSGNELARAGAIAIAEKPGDTSFNPLFIYGGVGLGKTHLIQAIGNKIIANNPRAKVVYLSSDLFTVEFVEAIQSNKANEFSNYYKNVDTLILDDIQFLVGKEKTQDLFFHIFNTLHQSGKQIILSSDKAPKDLKGLNERLISRFQWGLTADVQPPDFETRTAIVMNKAESFGMSLPNNILEYIAHNVTSNIRELEGCLIKLLAASSLSSREIDFELVKKTVKEISTGRQINISIDYITHIVCEFFDVEENRVREKNRKKEVVTARQVAMYLSKKMTKSSLKTIGLHFGGRDHATVIHAFNTIEHQINDDLIMREKIENIRNKIELSVI
ncbi:MAG: chromosomal replication initiator protein DnaA [Ignavibacteriales bacterium]|nr:chromosomal replication initiator protein DnaA [Ignavibacteriales bacterium]MCF8305588.1 chromosomal replication initiator protein DnaA [Ignavibacteriales bacterium]MCF8315310.1 chromosomal replication initiator protein DnaA [Ignavibacteriales bacterium]MCF8436798.1 chromosomal replication initiator protein DnaA [Ignavibacteriales bacterium]